MPDLHFYTVDVEPRVQLGCLATPCSCYTLTGSAVESWLGHLCSVADVGPSSHLKVLPHEELVALSTWRTETLA